MSVNQFSVLGIPKDQYQMKYGESILSEFVKSYDYTSLIDELIQNDYDAESPESKIELFEDRLVSTGFGKPIDEAGWQRLKLAMGTGKGVPPKQSRLGVKNQGLRALFLLGDSIVIRSHGHFTVLSIEYGSLKRRKKDDVTKGLVGTIVEVPYRSSETDEFPVFTVEKERTLMQELEATLPLKLGMLSIPEYRHVMNKVEVISHRIGVRLTCKQEILKVKTSTSNNMELERRISLERGRTSR